MNALTAIPDDGVVLTDLTTVFRYCNDRTYAALIDAEQEARRARFLAAMAPHDARVRAEQEMRWAAEARGA